MCAFCIIGNNNKVHMVLAEAVSVFFMLYVLSTAVLYAFGLYSLKRCEVLSVIVSALICIVTVLVKRRKPVIDKIHITKYNVITLIIIIICMALSLGNYDAYGMGQDEGVYQIEAVNILEGKPAWNQSIDEWKLMGDEDRDTFIDYSTWFLAGFDSYYSLKDYFDEIKDIKFLGIKVPSENEFTGYFHGIPTYPSFLALSAGIFGIKHMAWGNVILLACSLIFLNEIMSAIGVNRGLKSILLILLGVSPQIVWINMSTLTEAGILLILLSFLYHLIVNKDTFKEKLAVLSILTFSVYHVSIYTMMPLFVLLMWGYGIFRKKKKYFRYATEIIAGYLLGFVFMARINPRYTLKNYTQAIKFIDNEHLLILIIFLICIFCVFVSAVLLLINSKIKTFSAKKTVIIMKYIISLSVIMIIAVSGYSIISHLINGKPGVNTNMAFAVLTGIVIYPVTLIILLLGKYENNYNSMTILAMFEWCVAVFSLIMLRNIAAFYYYSRYLAPFIPIILLTAALMLNGKKKSLRIAVPIISVIICLPFQFFLHTNRDDSRMDWDTIKFVTDYARDNFSEDTVLVMDRDLLTYFYFPVRAVTDAHILPTEMNISSPNRTRAENDWFYLTKADIEDSDHLVFETGYTVSEDTLDNRIPFINLPTYFKEEAFSLKLYDYDEYIEDSENYNISDCSLRIESIECSNEGEISLEVSGITGDDQQSYYNNDNYYVSYHIIDEGTGDVISYDNFRYFVGYLVTDRITMDLDLDDYLNEATDNADLIVAVDIVEEGVKWLSWDKDNLPEVRFTYNINGGWKQVIE